MEAGPSSLDCSQPGSERGLRSPEKQAWSGGLAVGARARAILDSAPSQGPRARFTLSFPRLSTSGLSRLGKQTGTHGNNGRVSRRGPFSGPPTVCWIINRTMAYTGISPLLGGYEVEKKLRVCDELPTDLLCRGDNGC